jgi:ankyrin repeat protein
MKLKLLMSSLALSTLMAGGAWAKSPMLTEAYWETATVASVQADIEAGADLLERNKIGRQPLHYALRGHASLDVLRLLLEQGVPIRPEGGKLFDYLVEKGSDPEGIDSEGRDLFMKAITNNDNTEMLQRFFNDSEDPKARDNYGLSGVLLASIESISEQRLAFLEAQDFDLSIRDPKGRTALHLHAVEGDSDGLTALLARGFDINATDSAGDSPLHLALKKNEVEFLSAMLDAGADLQVANGKGVTPLMLALAREADEDMSGLIDRMIAAGADLKAKDASGATTLIHAMKGRQPVSRLQQILDRGVDVNAADGEGSTALMHAALSGEDPQVLTLLLNAGADKTVRDVFEDTVAVMAADNPALQDSPALAQLL